MTVKELKELLSEYDDDREVLVYDECNEARDITGSEERANPYKCEECGDFVMLCVDYDWHVSIGDLI